MLVPNPRWCHLRLRLRSILLPTRLHRQGPILEARRETHRCSTCPGEQDWCHGRRQIQDRSSIRRPQRSSNLVSHPVQPFRQYSQRRYHQLQLDHCGRLWILTFECSARPNAIWRGSAHCASRGQFNHHICQKQSTRRYDLHVHYLPCWNHHRHLHSEYPSMGQTYRNLVVRTIRCQHSSRIESHHIQRRWFHQTLYRFSTSFHWLLRG